MPDERAIMTYVSSYYHCFAGKIKVNSLKESGPALHLFCFFIFLLFCLYVTVD